MTTSKPPGSGSGGGPPGNGYTRFIPREELKTFAAWNPNSLEEPGAARKPAPGESPAGGGVYKAPFAERVASAEADAALKGQRPSTRGAATEAAKGDASTGKAAMGRPPGVKGSPTPEPAPGAPEPVVDVEAVAAQSRQAGYQDGYRDGLSALEGLKQAQAAQMAAFMSDQVGNLVSELHTRLDALEQQLSGRIAGVALELARQVVRSEISQRPEMVVAVAEEALNTLLSSARQVTVNMHPDDYALARGALSEQLTSRGARVVADPHVSPGGCVVGSDIAVVDARVEARWLRAAAAMGIRSEWDGGPVLPVIPDDDDGDGPHADPQEQP